MIVIPDIHGRYDKLQALLEQLEPYAGHPMVFLGDLVDRGPDSFMVMETVNKLIKSGRAELILSNHEEMFLWGMKAMREGHALPSIWMSRHAGGQTCIDSYAAAAGTTRIQGIVEFIDQYGHQQMLENAKPYVETPGCVLTHAPIPANALGWRTNPETLRWVCPPTPAHEGLFPMQHTDNQGKPKLGISGHVNWVSYGVLGMRVYKNPNHIYLDGGCGCHPEAPLHALVVDSNSGQVHGTLTV